MRAARGLSSSYALSCGRRGGSGAPRKCLFDPWATFGTYVVDDGRRTFTLTPRGAADPDVIGTEVLRHVTVDAELAVFNTPTAQVDGFDATTYITWHRVTPR